MRGPEPCEACPSPTAAGLCVPLSGAVQPDTDRRMTDDPLTGVAAGTAPARAPLLLQHAEPGGGAGWWPHVSPLDPAILDDSLATCRRELAVFKEEAAVQSSKAHSANAVLLEARTQIAMLEAKLETSSSRIRRLEAQVAAQALEIQHWREGGQNGGQLKAALDAQHRADFEHCEARLAQLERDLAEKEQQLASMHLGTLAGDTARVSSLALAAELQEKLTAKDRQLDRLQAHADSVTRELELRQEVLKTFEARLGQVERAAQQKRPAPRDPSPPPAVASFAAPAAEPPRGATGRAAEPLWGATSPTAEPLQGTVTSVPREAAAAAREAALEDARLKVQQLYDKLAARDAAAIRRLRSDVSAAADGAGEARPEMRASADLLTAPSSDAPTAPGTPIAGPRLGIARPLEESVHDGPFRVGCFGGVSKPSLSDSTTTCSPDAASGQLASVAASTTHGSPLCDNPERVLAAQDETSLASAIARACNDARHAAVASSISSLQPPPAVRGVVVGDARPAATSPLRLSRPEAAVTVGPSGTCSPCVGARCRSLTPTSPALVDGRAPGASAVHRRSASSRGIRAPTAATPVTPRFVSPLAAEAALVSPVRGVAVPAAPHSTPLGSQTRLHVKHGTPPRSRCMPVMLCGGPEGVATPGKQMPSTTSAASQQQQQQQQQQPAVSRASTEAPVERASSSPRRVRSSSAGPAAGGGAQVAVALVRPLPTPMGVAAWPSQARLLATLGSATAAPASASGPVSLSCAASRSNSPVPLQTAPAAIARRWPQVRGR
uniref:Uncharacterized protein n=1 Tax=Alexandrium monilatum TaxID=311494 RepID=A0A6T1A855_9DINO